ncbi:hypothetical protein CVT25_008685 [Psilocybe cyanescens]|uniref:Uncharacterized protein n=1 Tax=Psilocybe cyanescens TaxID=93625 RepID=A0A409XLG4_PSICY|nr:hypothetical protein CVT25_008685 [Psilocybe cyanescens]
MTHTTAVTDTSQATASRIATITAIAAIGNARNVPNSKKVVLDAQVYVGSENLHVSKFQVIIASSSSFSIDPSQHAYLHVTGVATNCQKEQGTFDLDVDRYISVLKPVQKVKPSAPTRSQICLAIKLESRSHTTNIMYQYSVF